MRVVISQARFLPALNIIERINLCDVFVLYDTAQFTRRDWENRNAIKTEQGALMLSVPIAKHLRGTPGGMVRIQNETAWAKKMAKSIEMAYCHAPFWGLYGEEVLEILTRPWTLLIDLNEELLRYALTTLGITTRVVRATHTGVNRQLMGNRALLTLTKAVGGYEYISGPMGVTYLNKRIWRDGGVPVRIHRFNEEWYAQQHGHFQSHTAWIDALFNLGAKGTMELLQQEITEDNCPWEIQMPEPDKPEEGEGVLGQPGVSIYGSR